VELCCCYSCVRARLVLARTHARAAERAARAAACANQPATAVTDAATREPLGRGGFDGLLAERPERRDPPALVSCDHHPSTVAAVDATRDGQS
jgi:hypothetical protein